MSKIVQAVNSMIANPGNITNVIKGESESFFLYKGKYKWSICCREDGYHLWFYPGNETIETLASYESGEWGYENVAMLHYHDAEIGTKEAKASFAELHTLVKEKAYGIDKVLDDIILDGLI